MEISTSGKQRYQRRFIPSRRKKLGELQSTNKKVLGAHVDLP